MELCKGSSFFSQTDSDVVVVCSVPILSWKRLAAIAGQYQRLRMLAARCLDLALRTRNDWTNSMGLRLY